MSQCSLCTGLSADVHENNGILLAPAFSLFMCSCRRQVIANSMARAAEIQAQIRVVKQQPTAVLASLLDSQFSNQVSSAVLGESCAWWVGMQAAL